MDFNNMQYLDLIIRTFTCNFKGSIVIAIFRLFNHYATIAEYCLPSRSAEEFSR